jgi:hypothetical protein
MDSSPSIAGEVMLRSGASAADERDVMEAFSAIGVAATIRFAPTRRRLDGVEWLVLAALPLQAFLSGLGSKLAEDVHGGLTKGYGSSWIFGPRLTCANARRRVQHPAFSLVRML